MTYIVLFYVAMHGANNTKFTAQRVDTLISTPVIIGVCKIMPHPSEKGEDVCERENRYRQKNKTGGERFHTYSYLEHEGGAACQSNKGHNTAVPQTSFAKPRVLVKAARCPVHSRLVVLPS